MTHNNNDWELIRQEMENKARIRRIERLEYKNELFVRLFPKHMHNKILEIETYVVCIPIIIFLAYILIRLIAH